MREIKTEILSELDDLEMAIAARLLVAKRSEPQQTDLETAILSRQVQSLRAANARANAYIGEALVLLKKGKK
ncbi:MAG: hypothetical protein LBB23_02010 [Rickettsiales bacterium]|jgi:hypothetical protein|nr:hypothetical protein [Rickettsiales bacterium]